MNSNSSELQTRLATGLFRVETSHGTSLQRRPDGYVVHAADPEATLESLLLFVPEATPTLGFLMAAHEVGPLFIDPNKPSIIVPLRLQRDHSKTPTGLRDPSTGLYLCAILAKPGDVAPVVINRDTFGPWESFSLVPVATPVGDSRLIEEMRHLEKWASLPLTGPQVLETLESGSVSPSNAGAFDAFARQLPRDQIEWLGPTILGRQAALTNLATIFPGDLFAAVAFPDLSRWLASRPQAVHANLPSGLDDLAKMGIDGKYTSIGHIAITSARRCIPARRQICVLATARNEGLYLLEWIAYHRSIGIEGIFIYSNDNSDESDTLLDILSKAGVITWISSELAPGSAAQPKAYGHALGLLPHILDYRWTLVIDLDEFFVFDSSRFLTISEFLDWHETQPVDAIALNWLVYGSCGQDEWSRIPLGSRFVQRLPWLDPHIKTIVRTNAVMHSRPHHPVTDVFHPLVTRNATGGCHVSKDNNPSFSADPQATTAWINHYFLKSADEFLWKFSRNRGDYALVRETTPETIDPAFLEMFANQHRSTAVTTDDRILAFARRQSVEMETLMALPGVTRAVELIEGRYRDRLAYLKNTLHSSPKFNTPGTPHERFARLLRR